MLDEFVGWAPVDTGIAASGRVPSRHDPERLAEIGTQLEAVVVDRRSEHATPVKQAVLDELCASRATGDAPADIFRAVEGRWRV
jgi:hypothetical protein